MEKILEEKAAVCKSVVMRLKGKSWLILFFLALGRELWALPPLGQQEVVARVLEKNLGVQAAVLEGPIAKTDETKTLGQFDTRISGQIYYNLDRSDQTSIVFGTDNREFLYEARVEKKFPVGVQGALSFTNLYESSNSAFATDPTLFESLLRMEVRTSLLRNRLGKTDKASIDLSRSNTQVVEKASQRIIDDEVARSLVEYWSVVAAQYYVDVAQRFLKLAKDFQSSNQEKKGIGLAEDTDLFATQAQVVEREAELLRSKNLLKDFKQQLLTTLNYPLDESVRPKNRLSEVPTILSREEALSLALRFRPDYQALLQEAQSKKIQIAIAKDQKWPILDFYNSLELNSVDPAFGQTLGQTFLAEHPNVLTGLQFQVHLENREAKSALQKAELEKLRVLVRIKELENRIALEVDEKLRELQLQKAETQKLGQAADLQRKKMESELDKFNAGRSSTDFIIRYQDDYLVATRRHLEAQLRLHLAYIELNRALSTLIPRPTGASL